MDSKTELMILQELEGLELEVDVSKLSNGTLKAINEFYDTGSETVSAELKRAIIHEMGWNEDPEKINLLVAE